MGHLNKPKDNNKTYKPKVPFNAKPKFNPKPIKVWRPKPKKTITNGEIQNLGNLPSTLTSSMRGTKGSDVVAISKQPQPQADSRSSLRIAQSAKVSDGADIDFIGANEPDIELLGPDRTDTELLCSDEADESSNTSDVKENLQRDIRLIL